MVDLPEVEDKLPPGSFTERAETDGVDIGQTVGIRQAKASGDARTAAKMRSEARVLLLQTFYRNGESSGNAYDNGNNSFICCYI